MKYEEWTAKFKPVKNPFDPTSGFSNTFFEPFGNELIFIKEQEDRKVWTLIFEDGFSKIVSGFQQETRSGFFVTEILAPKDGLEIPLN